MDPGDGSGATEGEGTVTRTISIIEDGRRLVRTFDTAVDKLKFGALLETGCTIEAVECVALLQTMETVRLHIVETQELALNEPLP